MTRAKDISKIITDADFSGTLDVTGTVTAGSVAISDDNNYSFGDGTTYIQGSGAADRLKFITNASEAVRIDSSGNVGIGTSSMTELLEVHGDTPSIKLRDTSAYSAGTGPFISFQGNDSGGAIRNFADIQGLSLTSNNGVLAFSTRSGGTVAERVRITDVGRVGIGTSSPSTPLHVQASSQDANVRFQASDNGYATRLQLYANNVSGASYNAIQSYVNGDSTVQWEISGAKASSEDQMLFSTGGSERMRINSSGQLLVGKTSTSAFSDGVMFSNAGNNIGRDSNTVLDIHRGGSDGNLVAFYAQSTFEGSISVSGTTVSYNGGHLARWSRLLDNSKDTTIVKGTVMTNLDEMVEWDDEDNEQLNKMAVSSVEGDANVAGVFVNWDDDDDFNDMNIAMTGDMVIRIAQGTTVARGDLLMSAGDGTAKPQDDDIVRSKTIAKVTSTNISHTYDDGTYLVPCVLMAC